MKRLALFIACVSVCYAKIVYELHEPYREGDQFFYFPGDGDDELHLVDINEPVDEDIIAEYERQPNNFGYWLFTRSHPTEAHILVYEDDNSLTNSDFKKSRTTVFLIHGWLGSGDNQMNHLLKEAFLENDDVNVIVFDWSRLAGRNYLTAKNGVSTLGKGLSQFIKWLRSFGVSYDNIHLVGFSLGAHIVGNAGRYTNSLIRRITALDPAGPLWSRDENKLQKTDAKYVEVIHTNTFMYGYTEPCGHADFYPNGGSRMPGCWINLCSHRKGYEYMVVSINNKNFVANECNNLEDATKNTCTGSLYPMGSSDLNKSRSGIFRVNTE